MFFFNVSRHYWNFVYICQCFFVKKILKHSWGIMLTNNAVKHCLQKMLRNSKIVEEPEKWWKRPKMLKMLKNYAKVKKNVGKVRKCWTIQTTLILKEKVYKQCL